MKIKRVAYAVLALAAWASAVHAESGQDCPSKFSLDGLLTKQQTRMEDAKPSIDPALKNLFSSAIKSFACQAFINYYAERSGVVNALVRTEVVQRDNITEMTFSSKSYPKICGAVRYEVPLDIGSYGTKTRFGGWLRWGRRTFNEQVRAPLGGQAAEPTNIESEAYRALIKATFNDFAMTIPDVMDEANDISSSYLPEGRPSQPPTAENLIKITQGYQDRMFEGYGKITAQNAWKDGDSRGGKCCS